MASSDSMAQVFHGLPQAGRDSAVDQALDRTCDTRSLVSHTFEVADGLGDRDQQAQVDRAVGWRRAMMALKDRGRSRPQAALTRCLA
jgi:hypothetical protein